MAQWHADIVSAFGGQEVGIQGEPSAHSQTLGEPAWKPVHLGARVKSQSTETSEETGS